MAFNADVALHNMGFWFFNSEIRLLATQVNTEPMRADSTGPPFEATFKTLLIKKLY